MATRFSHGFQRPQLPIAPLLEHYGADLSRARRSGWSKIRCPGGMMEIWKSINEWYDVSDFGRVRSWHNNRWGRRKTPLILSPDIKAAHGYPRVNIAGDARLVHHLVLEAFIGPRPPGMEGAHRNGVKLDNRIENLYWATPKENGEDNARLGVSKGERHGLAKLTDDSVRFIRSSGLRRDALADMFNVSKTTIQRVLSGRGWTHVQ